jgi:hypothetical protein
MLLVRADDRPSLRALDAFDATLALVTLLLDAFAILESFLSRSSPIALRH